MKERPLPIISYSNPHSNRNANSLVWDIQTQLGRFHIVGMGKPYDVVIAPESLPGSVRHYKTWSGRTGGCGQ
jgi:hypothetical protein